MIASYGDPDPPEPYNFSGCNNYKNAQNNSEKVLQLTFLFHVQIKKSNFVTFFF